MAETILDTDLSIKKYRKDFLLDYTRASRFKPYMGKGQNNIIMVVSDLEASAGDEIIVPMVGELEGSGVSGSQVLEGNEEELDTTSMRIRVTWRRHGVVVPKSEQSKTEIDLLKASKGALTRWFADKQRFDVIRELGAITAFTPGNGDDQPDVQISYAYASASEAQKDAWLALNSDRVLFGKDWSNNSSNDHSASLANIDTTNDRATATMLLKAKARAKEAKIRPYMTKDGEEWYVVFAGSRAYRDLSNDADIKAANTNAAPRDMSKNPIFIGGDLTYQGLIIREEHEAPIYTGVGASASDVSPLYMAGGGAVGVAWGETPTPQSQNRDYNFRKGVGMEELVGVKKITKRGVQKGVLTIYASAPADT
jgi:N4-gp56 family major capsid protein